MPATVHVWSLEVNLSDFVLPFHHADSGDEPQAVKLSNVEGMKSLCSQISIRESRSVKYIGCLTEELGVYFPPGKFGMSVVNSLVISAIFRARPHLAKSPDYYFCLSQILPS